MKLHSIVSRAIGAVNARQLVTIQISTGYATNPQGKRVPSYAAPQMAYASIQALQYNDIVQADGMQIQGVRRKLYIHEEVEGLVRANNKGGDIVTLADGTVWLVALIAEHWPTWTAAIITLQNNQ